MDRIKKYLAVFLVFVMLITNMPLSKINAQDSDPISKASNIKSDGKNVKKLSTEEKKNKVQDVFNSETFDRASDVRKAYIDIVDETEKLKENSKSIKSKVDEVEYLDAKYKDSISYSDTEDKSDDGDEYKDVIGLSYQSEKTPIKDGLLFINLKVDDTKLVNKTLDDFIVILPKGVKLQEKAYSKDSIEKIKTITEKLDELENKISAIEETKDISKVEELNELKSTFKTSLDELKAIKADWSLEDTGYMVDQEYAKKMEKLAESKSKDSETYIDKYKQDFYSIRLVKNPDFKSDIKNEFSLAYSFDANQELYHGDLIAVKSNAQVNATNDNKKNSIEAKELTSILKSNAITDPDGAIQKSIDEDQNRLELVKKSEAEKKDTQTPNFSENKKDKEEKANVPENELVDNSVVNNKTDIDTSKIDFESSSSLQSEDTDPVADNLRESLMKFKPISILSSPTKAQDLRENLLENLAYTSPLYRSRRFYTRNEASTRLTVYKKDENDKELKGASFNLKSSDPNSSYDVTIGEGNDISTFEFNNLNSGNYVLTEESAPKGYKKTSKVWNVYVAPNGAIFVNEKMDNVQPEVYTGKDVSGELSGDLRISTSVEASTPLIFGGDNLINIKGDLYIAKVNPGDYFDVKISDTIHYNALQPDKPNQPPIVDEDGKVLARPTLIKSDLGGEKVIRYTFTNEVLGRKDIKLGFNLGYSVDFYAAKTKGNYDFAVSIGNQLEGKVNKYVDFNLPKSNGNLNLDTAFSYTNDQNGKYSQVVYVNPKGDYIDNGTSLEVRPYIWLNKQDVSSNHIVANISTKDTTIKVYKLRDDSYPDKFSDAVIFEKDKLEDVTSQFRNKIRIQEGKATVSFDSIGYDKYLVLVESNMKFPTGKIDGTYLVQGAILFDLNGKSVSSYTGIDTKDSSSMGSGSSYITKQASLTVKNKAVEKVAQKGKFRIKKKDQSDKLLPGASFELKNNAGKVVQAVSSEGSGVILYRDLNPGKYTLTEVKAPEGYEKSSKTWNVKVSNNGNVVITPNNTKESYINSTFIDRGNGKDVLVEKEYFDVINYDGLRSNSYWKPPTVSYLEGSQLRTKLNFTFNKEIKAGDYFYAEFKEPLTLTKLFDHVDTENILDNEKKVIATSEMIGPNKIKYTFTDYIEGAEKDVKASLEFGIDIDWDKQLKNGKLDPQPALIYANQKIVPDKENISVEYPKPDGIDGQEIGSMITKIGDSLVGYAYVNPNNKWLNPNSEFYLRNYFSSDEADTNVITNSNYYKQNDTAVKINGDTKLTVYKVPHNYKFTESFGLIEESLSEVKPQDNIQVEYGSKVGYGDYVKVKLTDSQYTQDRYVIKFETPYDAYSSNNFKVTTSLNSHDANRSAQTNVNGFPEVGAVYAESDGEAQREKEINIINYKKVLGKISFDKNGKDGDKIIKNIAGAKFELKREDGKSLNATTALEGVKEPYKGGESLTFETEEGKTVNISNLDPGVYILEEIEAPKGYTIDKKNNPKKFYVNVEEKVPDEELKRLENDRTTTDISENVHITKQSFISTQENDYLVRPNLSDDINVNSEFAVRVKDGVVEGDTFTVNLSKNVDINGIEKDQSEVADIKNDRGLIAKAEYNAEAHTIKYTFTRLAQMMNITNFSVNIGLYIDRKEVPNDEEKILVSYKVKHENSSLEDKGQQEFEVDYSIGDKKPKGNRSYYDINDKDETYQPNIGNAILSTDASMDEFESITYINPLGKKLRNMDVTQYNEFEYIGKGIARADISEIELYKVLDPSVLAKSYYVDFSDEQKLEKINLNYFNNPRIDEDKKENKASFVLRNLYPRYGSSDRYILRVVAKYSDDKNIEVSVNINSLIEGKNEYNGSSMTSHVEIYNPSTDARGHNIAEILNYKLNDPVNLQITKIDSKTKEKLSGAIFQLYKSLKDEDGKYKPMLEENKFANEVEAINGIAKFEKLEDGLYWIKETQAPSGYAKLTKPIGPFLVEEGKIYSVSLDQQGSIIESKKDELKKDEINKIYNFNVENFKAVYPVTGSIGTDIFFKIGIPLMLTSFVWFYKKKRDETDLGITTTG